MAADRPSSTPATPDRRDEVHETVRAEAFPLQLPDATLTQIELSYRSARRLLNIGASTRAFGELVRASRSFPMSRRLAAYLVRMALAAKTASAATALLQAGADDGEGSERFAVRRQLARLHRRSGELEKALEALVTVLAEDPADRRARRVLNVLLEREQRWEELDASYEKQANEALRRGRRDRAAKVIVARATLSARLGHAGQAALRYSQAAQLLEQARLHPAAFELRLQWLTALVSSGAGRPALGEAVHTCRVEAERTDQVNRFRATLRSLGLTEEGTFSRAGQTPTSPGEPAVRDVAPGASQPSRAISHPEFGWKTVAADAPRSEPAVAEVPRLSAIELRRQEAQFVAGGRWAELAAFYRGQIARTSDGSAKVELLSRLAEVLEDELHEPLAAAQAYGEIVALQGELSALREQLRLLRQTGDRAAVEAALDRAIELSRTPDQRADAHSERGELSLHAREFARARADFLAALKAQPRHLIAKVGLAEAAAASGELRPLRALLEPTPAISRKHPGRAELFRRLARLADRHDAKLARIAWSEVHRDVPDDEEAHRRLLSLVRGAGDDVALEPLLRTQLKRDPRGPEARKARMELVAALERLDRAADALAEVRAAVRFEPGHKEAWLALADRCERLGQVGEAAWALEQAATATDDQFERANTWERLSRFCRDVLRDPAKAALYAQRAENARALTAPVSSELQTSQAVTIPAPPRASITDERLRTDPQDQTPVNTERTAPLVPEREATLAKPLPPPRDETTPVVPAFAVAEPPARLEPGGGSEDRGADGGARADARKRPTPAAPLPPPVEETTPLVATAPPEVDRSETQLEMPAVALPAARAPELSAKTQELPEVIADVTPTAPVTQDMPAVGIVGAITQDIPEVDAPPTQEIPAVEVPAPPRSSGVSRSPSAQAKPRGRNRSAAADTFAKATPGSPAAAKRSAGGLDQAQFDKLRTDLPPQPKTPPAEVLEWEAPPAQVELRRKTEELLVAPDEFNPDPEISGFVPVAGSDRLADRDRLAKQVLAKPLDPSGYRALAELFTRYNDGPRAGLMREIADALEGKTAGPLLPARALSPLERAGLRHPSLRNEVGELLSLTGLPLCRAAGPRSMQALLREEFRLDSGAGSRALAEALLTSVRALSIRAPDLFLSEENGPPVTAIFQGSPKLLIGRLAVRRELPEGELRFFAARALFSLNPEVLVLATLPSEGLARALTLIGTAFKSNKPLSGPARAIREGLSAKSRDRVRELYRRLDATIDFKLFVDGATDSANRAGLVVAGGVAPALAALKVIGAGQREVVELIRFASSERYLGIRENKPPRVTSASGR